MGKCGLSVWTQNTHMPSVAKHGTIHCHSSIATSPGNIKAFSNSSVIIILPLPSYLLFCLPTLLHSFIHPCFPVLSLSTCSQPFSNPTMVASTRPKNKITHPAAPVMTEAAKQKAGIKTKRRSRKATKDETIWELQAHITMLENPGEEMFSKEPLVCTKL